ncbi:MAG: flagellar basal-body MS-ring/collar protein FliF, partial [Alphaproteobacteria bacterium]|nr:flagellar basal-body MS-ring/collar protein FliF [Alphaproteobacteria bacterium]
MNALTDFIKKIGFVRAASIAGILLASIIFFIILIVRTNEPQMGLLFSQIDPSDGGRIIDRLRALNIPMEVKGESNQIYVPVDQVARLRMELATDGLPAGGTIGYEIFDKTDVLGTTHALMDINFLRATEGEISKSIRTIQGVHSVRVHLVIPKRELFSQEKSSPSASIIIKMKGSSRLSVNQVLSIQHLVASAVPDLSLDKISIIDDKGTLLAKGQDRTEFGVDSAAGQQETRQAFEGKLSRSIESLLERTLGPGRARAEISAELDFDKVTSTSVEFNPDGQVARSTQNSSEGSNGNEASAADAITVQNALPEAGAPAAGGNQSKSQATRTDENTSFEISNTTRTHIKGAGAVKRLSIAVLVDGTYEKGSDGKDTYAPRAAEEITQITDLVKTAVGFKEDRGDTVKIVNMRFSETVVPDQKVDFVTKATDAFFRPKTIDLLMLLGAGVLLFLGLIKPMVLKLAGVSNGTENSRGGNRGDLLSNSDDMYG